MVRADLAATALPWFECAESIFSVARKFDGSCDNHAGGGNRFHHFFSEEHRVDHRSGESFKICDIFFVLEKTCTVGMCTSFLDPENSMDRLKWTGFGLQVYTMEEYMLLSAVLYVAAAVKRISGNFCPPSFG